MEGTLSPADVAVLSGNRNGDGFGDGSGWQKSATLQGDLY